MKKKSILILGIISLAMVFSFSSCKKADVATGTLKVIVSQGVSGTPGAGSYTLNVGDQMAYSFALAAGYTKLTVLLDGKDVAASGTFTVSGDHTLQAYADDNGPYTLTVTVSAGVSGTPAAGTYSYAKDAKVAFSYTLIEGYSNLSVLLDGTTTMASSSGTITMSANHSLSVSATEKRKIQGSWALSESYNDGSSFAVTATFSGNSASGTVTDSAGGSGTYTFNDTTAVFTIVFPDVTYTYSGTFSDADTMSGTCKRFQESDNVISGTWTATRGAAASTALSAAQAKARFSRR
jgi:hypothetical protein